MCMYQDTAVVGILQGRLLEDVGQFTSVVDILTPMKAP